MIYIKIYVPKPGISLAKAAYETTKPAEFFGLFQQTAAALTKSTVTVADLTAWALDAGYGAPNGVDQNAFLAIPASHMARLADYQRARLALLMHLLHIDQKTKKLYRHAVAGYLESSDKSDAAFILGGIACRYATEEWLKSRGRHLTRFWHYSIYSNPAVSGISFTNSTLKVSVKKKAATKPGASAPKTSKFDGDRRPDYLVQCNTTRWYAVEAKGTFGNFDHADVKNGMDQARRLRSITFADPVLGPPGAAPTRYPIADYACSCAYFDSHDHLNVSFIDPPADPTGTGDDDDDVLELEIDTTIADMLQFHRVTQQFRSLAGVRPRTLPPLLASSDNLMRWSEISFSAARRAKDNRNRIWIGIPRALDREATRVRPVLQVMAALAPRLRGLFEERPDRQLADAFAQRLDVATADLRAGFTPTTRRVLLRMLAALHGGEMPPATWSEAMERCRRVPIQIGASQPATIDSMVGSMQEMRKYANYVALQLKVVTPDAELHSGVALTEHGLVVVSGGLWQPEPITRPGRKPKI